jgi:hypothetical protein
MNIHLILSLFHIICVVPLFLYVGFQRAATPEWLYNVLYGLGLLLLVFHGYKAIVRVYAKSSAAWINLFHAFLIAPLLLWIGYEGKKTGRPYYELVLIAGFGALGYHIKNIVMIIHGFTEIKGPTKINTYIKDE